MLLLFYYSKMCKIVEKFTKSIELSFIICYNFPQIDYSIIE